MIQWVKEYISASKICQNANIEATTKNTDMDALKKKESAQYNWFSSLRAFRAFTSSSTAAMYEQ